MAVGHLEIEHEDVRFEEPHRIQGFGTSTATTQNLEVAFTFEQPLQAMQDDRVVVSENESDRDGHTCAAAGNRISTFDPDALESTETLPPSDATRAQRLAGPRLLCTSVS